MPPKRGLQEGRSLTVAVLMKAAGSLIPIGIGTILKLRNTEMGATALKQW